NANNHRVIASSEPSWVAQAANRDKYQVQTTITTAQKTRIPHCTAFSGGGIRRVLGGTSVMASPWSILPRRRRGLPFLRIAAVRPDTDNSRGFRLGRERRPHPSIRQVPPTSSSASIAPTADADHAARYRDPHEGATPVSDRRRDRPPCDRAGSRDRRRLLGFRVSG